MVFIRSYKTSFCLLLTLVVFLQCSSDRYRLPHSIDFLGGFYKRKSYVTQTAHFFPFSILYLHAEKFIQGNIMYLECILPKQHVSLVKNVRVTYLERHIMLSKKVWGYRAFIGIPPLSRVGRHALYFNYEVGENKYSKKFTFYVNKAFFPKPEHFSITLSPQDLSSTADNQEFIQNSFEKKQKAFASRSPDQIRYALAYPARSTFITSEFWIARIRRIFLMKKRRKKTLLKKKTSYHSGVDLRGKVGDPIYAIASGRVVLADHEIKELKQVKKLA